MFSLLYQKFLLSQNIFYYFLKNIVYKKLKDSFPLKKFVLKYVTTKFIKGSVTL